MKYTFIIGCISAVFFFSCKKDKSNTPQAKLYPLSFHVSDFIQTYVPLGTQNTQSVTKTNNTADTLPVNVVAYLLYDANNKLVDKRQVIKTNGSFGKFDEQVPAGNYTAVFIGGAGNLSLTKSNLSPDIDYTFQYANYWGDTFYKKLAVTVTSGAVNQDVSLDRITAQLQVNIEDAIPADIKTITLSYNDTTNLNVLTKKGTPFSGVFTKTLAIADAGATSYKVTTNTLNNIKPFDVTIKCYTTNLNAPAIQRVVSGVVCQTNKRTVLSGRLFDPGNTSFAISIDTAWHAPINVGF